MAADPERSTWWELEAGRLAEENPLLAREAGIGVDGTAFGGLLDVNSASAQEFAQLPGIGADLAGRIVAIFGSRSTASTLSSTLRTCSTCRLGSSTGSATG